VGRGRRASGFAVARAEEFASLAALKAYARGSHEEVDRFFATVTDAARRAQFDPAPVW